jgi:hypothetical protein
MRNRRKRVRGGKGSISHLTGEDRALSALPFPVVRIGTSDFLFAEPLIPSGHTGEYSTPVALERTSTRPGRGGLRHVGTVTPHWHRWERYVLPMSQAVMVRATEAQGKVHSPAEKPSRG